MFEVNDEVKINTYDKRLNLVGRVIRIKTVRNRKAYVVAFKSGNCGTFFDTELLNANNLYILGDFKKKW